MDIFSWLLIIFLIIIALLFIPFFARGCLKFLLFLIFAVLALALLLRLFAC